MDLDRDFGGADVRWAWQSELADGRSPGSWARATTARTSCAAATTTTSAATLGVQGELRRNENDITYDIDEYTQVSWDFAPRWSLMAGVRHSDVQLQRR